MFLGSCSRAEKFISMIYLAVSSLVLLFMVLRQYHVYGWFPLLGWDAPYEVIWARRILDVEPLEVVWGWFVGSSYVNLYGGLIAFFGYLVGDLRLAQAFLPLLMGVVVVYAYFNLAYEETGSIHCANVTALMAGVSLNTIRLVSDFHRNFMSLVVIILLLGRLPNLTSGRPSRRSYLVTAALLFVAAYTHWWTYLIFGLTLIFYYSMVRLKSTGFLILYLLPLGTLTPYLLREGLKSTENIRLQLVTPLMDDVVRWMGGDWLLFLLFLAGLSLLTHRTFSRERASPTLCWFLACVILFFATIFGPFSIDKYTVTHQRFLFLMPVPVLLTLGVFLVYRGIETCQKKLG